MIKALTHPVARWSDWGSWSTESLRREAFFVESHDTSLYASLYAHPRVDPGSPGVVICQSWGIEADRTAGFAHELALEIARLGGVALLFHYPGYGDSTGATTPISLDGLADAVTAVAQDLRQRFDELELIVVGLMLGAAVAVTAAAALEPRRLLLVQPAFSPPTYFDELISRAERGRLGAPSTGAFAFGYPIPDRLRNNGPAATARTLTQLQDRTTIIRYSEPVLNEPVARSIERIDIEGTWRFGVGRHPELLAAAIGWVGTAGART